MRRSRVRTFLALSVPPAAAAFAWPGMGPLVPPEFLVYARWVAAAVPMVAGVVWLAVASGANVAGVRRVFPMAVLSFYCLALLVETAFISMPTAIMSAPLPLTAADAWRSPLALGTALVGQAILAALIVPRKDIDPSPEAGSESEAADAARAGEVS